MSALGDAYALATCLYGRDTAQPLGVIAERIYDVVEAMDFGADERKADLYAQLAEQLSSDTKFHTAVDIIEAAINSTNQRYQHG